MTVYVGLLSRKQLTFAAAWLNGSDIFLSEHFELWTLFNRITTTVKCFCLCFINRVSHNFYYYYYYIIIILILTKNQKGVCRRATGKLDVCVCNTLCTIARSVEKRKKVVNSLSLRNLIS